MSSPARDDTTSILLDLSAGRPEAVDRLLPVVYGELRRLAQSYLERESAPTIQATELVHEAYLKLVDQTRVDWRNRAHFFAVAAQAMRRLLVDRARHRARLKRGGPGADLSLDDERMRSLADPSADLVALDVALSRLAEDHPDHARVVELRFFGNLTQKDVAEVLGVGLRTVERYWLFARTWLYRELAEDADEETSER